MDVSCKLRYGCQFRIATHRTAFTLIEILCSIGVVAILLSLLLPAVISARESARRTQCLNNLRQIGIGVTSFHATQGHLPRNRYTFFELRAELELAEAIYPGVVKSSSSLRCPSDRYELPEKEASYFLNHGSAILPRNGAVDHGRGMDLFGKIDYISFNEFSDGLSNTALFSEHKQLDYLTTMPKADDRVSWASPKYFKPREEQLLATFLDKALQNRQLIKRENIFEVSHTSVDNSFYYDHLWSPNRPLVVEVLETGYPYVISPSSFHNDGVNLLFADGHVDFISDSVSRSVWQSIGSRNGGEVAAE